MRVLLISIKSDLEGGYPAAHLGFYRIGTYLRDNGIDVDVADLEIDDLAVFLERLRRGHYDAIGFSVSNYEMEKDLDLLWACKEASKQSPKRCLMIAGGQQAVLNRDQWLEECGIDLSILGYGERPMLEVCQRYKDHPDAEIPELCEGILGTAYIDNDGKLIAQPQPSLTQEEFEFLNHERMLEADIPYERYWEHNEKRIKSLDFNQVNFRIRNIRMYTTSHCPLRCAFCSSQYFNPAAQETKAQKIVMLSSEQIHELILHLYRKHKANSFFFGSDNFIITNYGRTRAKEFCQLVIQSKKLGELPEDVVFHCMARVDSFMLARGENRVFDHEMIHLMKQAGFVNVSTGVETFSDRLLRAPSINKLNISSEDNITAIETLLAAGLTPQILLILGIPETTEEDLMFTMKVAADFILKGAQVGTTSVLFADPGAPVTTDKRYSYNHREWKNPYTGQIIKINDKILPFDPKIKGIIHKIDDASEIEMARMREGTPWEEGILPKFFVGLAQFVAISKLLNNEEMVEHFEGVFQKVCTLNSPDIQEELEVLSQ